MSDPEYSKLFKLPFFSGSMAEALARVRGFIPGVYSETEPIVITPNTDIVVQLEEIRRIDPKLHERLANAFLVIPDGFPILMAARLTGRKLQSVLPGADMMVELLEASDAGRVLLVAPDPVTAEKVSIRARKNASLILQTVVAPVFEIGNPEFESFVFRVAEEIQSFSPAFVLVCLGFPKEERLSLAVIDYLKSKGEMAVPLFFGLGASAEFFAGTKKRAAKWMRKIHMEWFHRMVHEPRRLVRRYLRDAVFFIPIVYREWREHRKSK